jgi:hypothetical protein
VFSPKSKFNGYYSGSYLDNYIYLYSNVWYLTNYKFYLDSSLPNFFIFYATPYQEYSIDAKLDDGLPDKGRVRDFYTGNVYITGSGDGYNPCVTSASPNAYDLTPATANIPAAVCQSIILW